MPLDELLQPLYGNPAVKFPCLSVYLDLRPDGSGKKRYTPFLKNRLSDLSASVPSHSADYESFERDVKRIQKYLEEDLDQALKGIALLACSAAALFLPVPMPVSPENAVFLDSSPRLFNLIRCNDLYKTHAVVVADSKHARIFLVRLGRPAQTLTLSWEEKHTTRFGRMGWSLSRFQRHLQEHVKQRAKEIVENLEKLASLEKLEYVFASSEEGMEAELVKHFPAAEKKRLVFLPSLDSRAPDHKVLNAASDSLRAICLKRAENMTHQILEEAEPLGQATSGPEPTLSALQNHQIERMVFDAHFQAPGWRCEKCSTLGSGGLPQSCPLCRGGVQSLDLREEIAARARAQRIEMAFTENYPPLMKAGGVAALLKFKTIKRTTK